MSLRVVVVIYINTWVYEIPHFRNCVYIYGELVRDMLLKVCSRMKTTALRMISVSLLFLTSKLRLLPTLPSSSIFASPYL